MGAPKAARPRKTGDKQAAAQPRATSRRRGARPPAPPKRPATVRPVAPPAAKPKVAAPAKASRGPRKPEAQKAKPSAAPSVERLTDEERIEDAKYQPRTAPRLFQEERFLFPETYGVTRIRLLVKDPEWVFVHWDVDSKTLAALRSELGERTMALTRLTLRVVDAQHGGGQTILLPPGARSWYVRTDSSGPRSYRAELGVTLPSGDFRSLAASNTVVPPRVGPSPERATVKKRLARTALTTAVPTSASAAPIAPAEAASEPWRPTPSKTDADSAAAPAARTAKRGSGRAGASDAHRR